MAQFLNHNSFLLAVVPVVLLLLFLLLRPPGSLLKQVLALLLLAAVVVGFLLARPGRRSATGSQAEALLLDAGRPSLLEVYSNY